MTIITNPPMMIDLCGLATLCE